MANDGGVWVKMGNAAPAGAAVINDAASNYDNKDAGVTIDGKTYDIYTFTTATTTRSVRLTDEARARITDEDLLMAVATTPIPDDFTGDPATLFDRKYRNQLRNAFEITPAVDPGLSLTVDTPGLVDALIVAGGGGGGCGTAGGAGAGGYLEASNIYLSADTHPVTVGSGGAGAMPTGSGDAGVSGNAGGSSRIANYYAPGGSPSIGWTRRNDGKACTQIGIDGPSGSGASGGSAGSLAAGGAGAAPLGNNGGAGSLADEGRNRSGGGGGGAGGAGGDAAGTTGGAAGLGLSSSITGSPVTRAAGGAGCGGSTLGANGEANTGNGGGGTGKAGEVGGDGGSGIVIVRVEI